MKYRLCIVYTALLVLVMGAATLHAQDRLVLGSGGGPETPQTVISTRILTEAYGRIGIEVERQRFPAPRSLSMANRGTIDGELHRPILNRDEFPNLIKIPVPILYGELVVFTKDVDFEITGWDSLKPYTFGIQASTQETSVREKGIQAELVTDADQLFKKLASGRNDIIVIPRGLGMDVLKSMLALPPEGIDPEALQGIRILEPPLQRDALYHYLHTKHAELVPKITAVLQEMEEEGLLQRIKEEFEAEVFE